MVKEIITVHLIIEIIMVKVVLQEDHLIIEELKKILKI